jgi:cobalt-zinc-cadmium efflux system outer membrane protein
MLMPRTALRLGGLLIGGMVSFAGCASVNPGPDFDRVDRQVESAIGERVGYRPGDEPAVRARVAELLEGGLSVQEAVQLALLNNPRVWAGLMRTGMARADVVQAGLFTNPTVGILLRFPEAGGLADLETALAQNIADLWMIPARTRAAERDLDRSILETAREATAIANDVKVAYFNAVAAQRAWEISRENLALVEQLLRITEARLEAGAVGVLDVNLVRGLRLRAEVDQRNARLAAATARRTLATLLGLEAPAEDLALIDPLPAPLTAGIDAEQLIEVALQARLDLRAARDAVAAAEARVRFEYARVFQNVELSFELERSARRAPPGRNIAADTARASIARGALTAPEVESRGQRRLARSQEIEAILGPGLSVTLPLFDQNQAQIARARLALQEADALLESLQRAIAQETREAVDRATTAWAIARIYEQEVLPQAQTTLELSQSAYQAGQTSILNVIDAQRSLLETRQAYIAALQSAATALVDLERATARPAAVLLQFTSTSTRPASLPPAASSEPGRQPENRIDNE